MEETPGRECLDDEARTAVYELRNEIDRLFFHTFDNSKNLLNNKAVLCSVYLTPGGARMLKEVVPRLEVDDPNNDAAEAVAHMCDTLFEAPGAPAMEPTPGLAGGSGCSSRRPSEARMEARFSLTHWGRGRGATSSTSSATRPRSPASHARMELVAFLRLSETADWEALLLLWVRHRQQFPSLCVLAGSFFGAVGSSSTCERAFSLTGRLVSEERSSLSVESV